MDRTGKTPSFSWRNLVIVAALGVVAVVLAMQIGRPKPPIIGLITKTATNPFFVKMSEGAESSARARNAKLLTAAGKADGDHETQVKALRSMVEQGARAILITPSDAKAIVPEIAAARAKGVLVVALDSPTDPPNAVDSLFATDNFLAGQLIGAYAKVAVTDKPLKIATLDLFPGHPVGILRHNGFVSGMGLGEASPQNRDLAQPPEIVCMADSYGDKAKGREAMAGCLAKHPDINFVYTINELAAAGARLALDAAGKPGVQIVSIDGGCQGVRDVAAGAIKATAQQYPLAMASEGVAAAAEFIRTGKRPPGYVNTGVTLITDQEVKGVDSRSTKFGLTACWG